jgi:methionyl-tRNA formyltransferase
LPQYRGPSSINWPIIKGDTKTGLTIFRPNDGLDEGPVILQKTVAIGPDDTLGSVYFNHLFPLGVEAMLEAADLVVAGQHQEIVQDEAQASYEGWCKDKEAQVNWHAHIDQIYNLIRGCDPAPGAWTTIGGIKVRLYETRKHPVRRFEDVRGKPGEISAIAEKGVSIIVQGGQIELLKVKPEGGAKMPAAEFFTSIGFNVGNALTDPLPLPEAA